MIALSRTSSAVVGAEFEQPGHRVDIERGGQALSRLRGLHVGGPSRAHRAARAAGSRTGRARPKAGAGCCAAQAAAMRCARRSHARAGCPRCVQSTTASESRYSTSSAAGRARSWHAVCGESRRSVCTDAAGTRRSSLRSIVALTCRACGSTRRVISSPMRSSGNPCSCREEALGVLAADREQAERGRRSPSGISAAEPTATPRSRTGSSSARRGSRPLRGLTVRRRSRRTSALGCRAAPRAGSRAPRRRGRAAARR